MPDPKRFLPDLLASPPREVLGECTRLAVAAALVLLSCCLALGLEGPGSRGEASRGQGATLQPFSHSQHVSAYWLKPASGSRESGADCRGCHSFDGLDSATGGSAGPGFLDAEQCLSCHIPGIFEVMYSNSNTGTAREPREELSESFRHVEHLNLECAECHRESSEDSGVGGIVVPTGTDRGYCASCHSGAFEWSARLRASDPVSESRHRRTAEQMAATFSTGLTKRWRSGAVDFSHAAHVKGFAGGDFPREACVACHSEIMGRVEANVAPVRFDAGSCSECHVGMEAGAKVLEPAPSLTAGSFLHGRHSSLACSDCHAPGSSNPAGGGGPSSIVLKDTSGGDVYGGCVACHATIDQPGRGAPPLRVEGHGDLEAQGDCSACHVVGATEATSNELFRSLRPVAVHRRSALAHFLEDFSHSEVKASGTNAECSECHKAPPGEFRTSGQPVAFAHGDHLDLGGELDGGTCARCHTAMDAATAAVTRTEDLALQHRGLEGEGSCAVCHKSAYELRDSNVEDGAAPVERVVFSHADHAAEACLSCHESDTDSPAGIVTLPAARDCTQCHSHAEDELVPGQGGLDLRAVRDCALCHSLGVPTHGVPLSFQRLALTSLTGEFVHPELVDTDCVQCHRAEHRESPARARSERGRGAATAGIAGARDRWQGFRPEDLQFQGRYLITTDEGRSPHGVKYLDQRIATEERLGVAARTDGAAGDTYFESHIHDPGAEPQGTRCLPCHWNSVDRSEALSYTEKYNLVSEGQIRTKFAPGLLETWSMGLPGVRRPEPLFPR